MQTGKKQFTKHFGQRGDIDSCGWEDFVNKWNCLNIMNSKDYFGEDGVVCKDWYEEPKYIRNKYDKTMQCAICERIKWEECIDHGSEMIHKICDECGIEMHVCDDECT